MRERREQDREASGRRAEKARILCRQRYETISNESEPPGASAGSIIAIKIFTMRAGARKKAKNKFILEKGEFKLWHVEILTKQKQSTSKRISLRLPSQSPQWQKP